MKNNKENKIVVYQNSSGAIELRGDIKNETIWATQAQIAEIFNIERSVITKHIRNIYKDKELEENRTCAKIAQVQIEGICELNMVEYTSWRKILINGMN